MIPASPSSRALQPKTPAQAQQFPKPPPSPTAKPARKQLRRNSPAASKRRAQDELAKAAQLAHGRMISEYKLKSAWESIFERYSKDFEGIADEIDPVTGKIVVDNGHLRGMKDDSDDDNGESFGWGEIVGVKKGKKRKRGAGKENVEKGVKIIKTFIMEEKGENWEKMANGRTPNCKICRERDELDDSKCPNCASKEKQTTQNSSPAARRSPKQSVSNSTISFSESSELFQDVPRVATDIQASSPKKKVSPAKSPRIPKILEPEKPDETHADSLEHSSAETVKGKSPKKIPSDTYILEKLGSQETEVIEMFAKTRIQPNSTVVTDSNLSEPAIKSEPSSEGAPAPHYRENDLNKGASTPTKTSPSPTPQRNPSLQLPISPLHPSSIRSSPPHSPTHPAELQPVAEPQPGEYPFPTAPHDSDPELPLPLSKLKLHSMRKPPTPLPQPKANARPSSTPARSSSLNPWAPPDPISDPFYNPMWSDRHPDGTPEKFKGPRTPFTLRAPPSVTARKSQTKVLQSPKRASAKQPASTPAKQLKTPKPKKSAEKGRGDITPGWTFTTTAKKRRGKSLLSLVDDEVGPKMETQEREVIASPVLQRGGARGGRKFPLDMEIRETPPLELDLPVSLPKNLEIVEVKDEPEADEDRGIDTPATPGEAKCGEKGFKCKKVFCFKCIELEGQEDDLA